LPSLEVVEPFFLFDETDGVDVAESRTKNDAAQSSSAISISAGMIRIRDEAAFRLGERELASRFLSKVFSIAEIRSVRIDCSTRSATIRHEVDAARVGALLQRLSTVLRQSTSTSSSPKPEAIPTASKFSFHRHGSSLSTWEMVLDEPGRLRLRHEALRGDPIVADRIERQFRGQPGVRFVIPSERSGHLLVRYDPSVITSRVLLSLAEMVVRQPEPSASERSAATPVRYGVANLTLGVALAGELLLPILGPISAVLLIATNLRTFKAALIQLHRKRLGLPVLYLAIIATTLASGQFLASALMTWCFRFWHRRFRVELASERSRLLEEAGKDPVMARLMTPSGTEVLVTVGRLQPGDRLIISAGETVPADGLIFGGEGVVDERGVRGLEGAVRKCVGDHLLAGSTVLAGGFHLEVARVGEATRAASIRRVLVAATSPAPGPMAPTIRSEAFATRAVGPTLATAGIGFLAGDLLTVGAILRPDYATGPGLAVPLETLHNVALCARLGIIARDPEALERLAQVNLLVIEDHPVLARTELAVTKIETHLPEPVLLRYAASAFRHLVDDRGRSLIVACRERKIHVLYLEAVDFGRGVTVVHGKHKVRVMDADLSSSPTTPLIVEVDGSVVGQIEFERTGRLEAASVIEQVRRTSGLPFALVSSRRSSEVSGLAKALGVEMYRGDFRSELTADFLKACRKRGVKTAFIGDCRSHPEVAAESHVSISWASEAGLDSDPASLLMQRDGFDPLGELLAISREHATRVNQAQQFILYPNLVCVAGAFLFGFTGLTAVMLSNLGTLGLYRRASDSLRGLESIVPPGAGQPRRAG
jgi:cation transport ATPase